jgi:hypothetical protein
MHEKVKEALLTCGEVAVLSRHLLENEPISKLCDEFGWQPTAFLPVAKGF